MSTIKILEGGRAKAAYEAAQNAAEKGPAFGKKYKNGVVKKLPFMIKANGLGPALAFVKAKGGNSPDASDEKKAWHLVYTQLSEWLHQPQKEFLLADKQGDLVQIVIQMKSHECRAVTIEVLAFLNWLRRFSEGLIEGDEES